MRDAAGAAWREISEGSFVFRRPTLEAEALDTIRLADVVQLHQDRVWNRDQKYIV